jgi:phage-related protein
MEQKMRVILEGENRTSAAFSGVSKELDRVKMKVQDLQPAFQKMALAGAAATAAIGYTMGKMVKQASDLGESVNAVNVVFGEGAGKILEFGKNAATAVGMANSEFNQMSTITGALLKDTGLSMEEVAGETINLTERAADMASVFNTDVNDAMSAINQAIRGETEAIRRYAGDVTDASLQTYLLSKGITTSVTELTEQEKRLYRVELIMKQTAVTAGDFKNTQDSLANQQRILSAQFKDMSATLGAQLLPIVQKVLEAIRPAVDAIARWIEANPKLATGIMLAVGALAALTAVVGTLAVVTLAFMTVAWPIVGIVAGITLAVGLLIAAGVALYKNWDEIVAFATSAWNTVYETIAGVLTSLKEFFVEVWESIKSTVMTYIYFIVGLYAMLLDMIWPNWEENLSKMLEYWKMVWDGIKAFFVATWEWMKTMFASVSEFFSSFWEGVVEVFMWAKEQIGGVFDWISEKVEPIFDVLEKLKNMLKDIGSGVKDALGKVVDRGKEVLGARAAGGPVIGGGSYLVGEHGPEIFTPSTAGRISNGMGGSPAIVINFNGSTFMGREGIAQQIAADIVRQLQLRTKISY